MDDWVVQEGTFKERPLLAIFDKERYDKAANKPRPLISFGLAKARAIVDNFPDIQKFVEDHEDD